MNEQTKTAATRARYNRIAPFYDILETLAERTFNPWRAKVWQLVRGNTLEVGVGTGKNLPFHPRGARIVGMDLADQMLVRARVRACKLDVPVELVGGDVEQLEFPDNTFDTALATFVFCSTPDPVRGLRELNRVVKPNGRILLLEHVRIDRPIVGRFMDWANPFIVRLWGANINRRTLANILRAGLCIEHVENYGPMQMVKLIVARPNKTTNG